jgi:hypothetical protein
MTRLGFDSTKRIPGDLYGWYRTYWDNANVFTLIAQSESGTKFYLTGDGVKPEDPTVDPERRNVIFRFQ